MEYDRFKAPDDMPVADQIDPVTSGLNRALSALRDVTVYDRESVAAVLNCLAAQMKTSGFTDDDIQPIDHAADWVRSE